VTKYVVVMVANIAKDVVADGGVDVVLVDTDCDVLIIYIIIMYYIFCFYRLIDYYGSIL